MAQRKSSCRTLCFLFSFNSVRIWSHFDSIEIYGRCETIAWHWEGQSPSRPSQTTCRQWPAKHRSDWPTPITFEASTKTVSRSDSTSTWKNEIHRIIDNKGWVYERWYSINGIDESVLDTLKWHSPTLIDTLQHCETKVRATRYVWIRPFIDYVYYLYYMGDLSGKQKPNNSNY